MTSIVRKAISATISATVPTAKAVGITKPHLSQFGSFASLPGSSNFANNRYMTGADVEIATKPQKTTWLIQPNEGGCESTVKRSPHVQGKLSRSAFVIGPRRSQGQQRLPMRTARASVRGILWLSFCGFMVRPSPLRGPGAAAGTRRRRASTSRSTRPRPHGDRGAWLLLAVQPERFDADLRVAPRGRTPGPGRRVCDLRL